VNPQDELSENGTSFQNCTDIKTYCCSQKLHIYMPHLWEFTPRDSDPPERRWENVPSWHANVSTL